MIVSVGQMPSPTPQLPGAVAGQPSGQVMSLFLQLLTQMQGQQTNLLEFEDAVLPLAAPAPEALEHQALEHQALEHQALESVLRALEALVPYLPMAIPPAGEPLVGELLTHHAGLGNGGSAFQTPVQADIRQTLSIELRPNTSSGGSIRQAPTPLPEVPVAPTLLTAESQNIVAARPANVQPAPAGDVPPLAVLSHMGKTLQDGEAVLRAPDTPTTVALPQSNTSDLGEPSSFHGVGFSSLPSTTGAASASEASQASLAPPTSRPDLVAVTKPPGSLPRNTVLLQLEPPELGHLRVQVRLTDERLAAAFWAESPEVRTLLHTHLPLLQHALTQQGFQAQQISLTLATDGFSGAAGQFSQQHSAFQPFAHGREQGPSASVRDTLIAPGMTTDKYTHDGLVNVVI